MSSFVFYRVFYSAYVCSNNPMSCFSASVRDLNALVCSPSVSPIVSPISINVVCRCMIFHDLIKSCAALNV